MSIPPKLPIRVCLRLISLSPSKNAHNCFGKVSQNPLLQIGLVKLSMLKNDLNQFVEKRDQSLVTSHLMLSLKTINFLSPRSSPYSFIFKVRRCFQSLILKLVFGNLAFLQKTVPKQPSVSLMLIISGQFYHSVSKLRHPYFKKQWLRSSLRSSIML